MLTKSRPFLITKTMYKILANTIFLGKDVQFLSECHSTNDIALSMVKNHHAHEGTIVITDHQLQGRGQRGNKWLTERGMNLTFSIVLKPNFLDISEQFYLNMTISNGIHRLLQGYIPNIKIKWPNDLTLPDYGKTGGILIENTFSSEGWEYAVVGIGINVNQVNFENPKATSLTNITGSKFELPELFRLLVTQIEQSYLQLKRGKWTEIKSEYIHHLYLRDVWADYLDSSGHFKGKIIGISPQGKLEMTRENTDIQVFDFKEVKFMN